MKTNTIEFEVSLGDTETEGIVFYPKYFAWFDKATNAYLKSIGLNRNELLTQYHYAHPVTDCGCQFLHPLRYDERVQICTCLTDVQENYFRLQHVVYSGEDKLVIASGYETRAWVNVHQEDDHKHFVMTPIPPEMVAKLTDLKVEMETGDFSEFDKVKV